MAFLKLTIRGLFLKLPERISSIVEAQGIF
ncbi:hypothetical protein SCAR479_00435 [Seiridium cardinale]|uniref:Uncharacterized protein n=1 Tax=Seiridium cardinale TaxID=138064 RepID=A0ABR2YAC9_9PEZI